MSDNLCPTCGSKNFANIEISEEMKNKFKCNNCKKFWFM